MPMSIPLGVSSLYFARIICFHIIPNEIRIGPVSAK